jgi:hypothetical protein
MNRMSRHQVLHRGCSVTLLRQRRVVPSKWVEVVCEALHINSRQYGRRLDEVSVWFCDSDAELKKASGSYYVSFARGLVTRQGNIVLRTPGFAGVGLSDFRRIVVHEMNHLYWLRFVARKGVLWSPLWLVEALALRTAQNRYILTLPALRKELARLPSKEFKTASVLHFRYQKKRISSREHLRILYSLWVHFSWYLAPRSSRQLIEAVQRAKSLKKREVNSALSRVVGCKIELLYKKFVEERLLL